MRSDVRTVFLSFAEGGNSRAFLDEAHRQSFEAQALAHDTPRFRAATAELASQLRSLLGVDVLALLLAISRGSSAAQPLGGRGYRSSASRGVGRTRAGRFALTSNSTGSTFGGWTGSSGCSPEAAGAKVRRAGVASRKSRRDP